MGPVLSRMRRESALVDAKSYDPSSFRREGPNGPTSPLGIVSLEEVESRWRRAYAEKKS